MKFDYSYHDLQRIKRFLLQFSPNTTCLSVYESVNECLKQLWSDFQESGLLSSASFDIPYDRDKFYTAQSQLNGLFYEGMIDDPVELDEVLK